MLATLRILVTGGSYNWALSRKIGQPAMIMYTYIERRLKRKKGYHDSYMYTRYIHIPQSRQFLPHAGMGAVSDVPCV